MIWAALLTASPLDVLASLILFVFGVICFVPLAFFVRGAMERQQSASRSLSSHGRTQ
jgi:hypothetical protein